MNYLRKASIRPTYFSFCQFPIALKANNLTHGFFWGGLGGGKQGSNFFSASMACILNAPPCPEFMVNMHILILRSISPFKFVCDGCHRYNTHFPFIILLDLNAPPNVLGCLYSISLIPFANFYCSYLLRKHISTLQ